MSNTVKFIYILSISFLSFGGVYYLKNSLKTIYIKNDSIINLLKSLSPILISWQFWVGIFAYMITFIIFLVLIKSAEIIKIAPSIVGFNIVITVIGSYYLLNESLNFFKVLGILLIILGVYLTNKF